MFASCLRESRRVFSYSQVACKYSNKRFLVCKPLVSVPTSIFLFASRLQECQHNFLFSQAACKTLHFRRRAPLFMVRLIPVHIRFVSFSVEVLFPSAARFRELKREGGRCRPPWLSGPPSLWGLCGRGSAVARAPPCTLVQNSIKNLSP